MPRSGGSECKQRTVSRIELAVQASFQCPSMSELTAKDRRIHSLCPGRGLNKRVHWGSADPEHPTGSAHGHSGLRVQPWAWGVATMG